MSRYRAYDDLQKRLKQLTADDRRALLETCALLNEEREGGASRVTKELIAQAHARHVEERGPSPIEDTEPRWEEAVNQGLIAYESPDVAFFRHRYAMLDRALRVVSIWGLWHLFSSESQWGSDGLPSRAAIKDAEEVACRTRTAIDEWQDAERTRSRLPLPGKWWPKAADDIETLARICKWRRESAARLLERAERNHTAITRRRLVAKRSRTKQRREALALIYQALLDGGVTREDLAELWIESADWLSPPSKEFSIHYREMENGVEKLMRTIDEDVAILRRRSRPSRRANRRRKYGKRVGARAA